MKVYRFYFWLALATLTAAAPAWAYTREQQVQALHTLAEFHASTEPLNARLKQLLELGEPLRRWTKPELHFAVDTSAEIIGDCQSQLRVIDLNPNLFLGATGIREYLREEEQAAIVIHNSALELLDLGVRAR